MRVAITGASSGIGAAVARKMKEMGAFIAAFDLHQPPDNVDQWIEIDLGNSQSIASAVETVEGKFDVLINNAGLPPRPGLAETVLKVNFFGLRQLLGSMLGKLDTGASIVNTASRAGVLWQENLEQVRALIAIEDTKELETFVAEQNIDHVRAYNLSKEAVIVLTQLMTEDLVQRDIRINSISPAAVSTDILGEFKSAFGEKVEKAVARAGRPGEVDEIADVICFLASPQSRWIKGQNITIDGGISAMAFSDGFSA